MAQFEVNGIFEVTNIGHVLAGHIIAGEISAGDLIKVLKDDGNTISIKIKSVEFIDQISEKNFQIGLMLGVLEESAKIHVEKLVGKTVSINKGL